MLYDKNDETYGPAGFLLLIILCFLLLVLCSGCVGNQDTIDGKVFEYQRTIAELESRNRELESQIGTIRERTKQCQLRLSECREHSANIKDQIERILYEFEVYHGIVLDYIEAVDNNGTQIVDTSSD
jgi:septal ring factor EnvC (AmiA/AmiB activator)